MTGRRATFRLGNISPWIVMNAALEPFRVPTPAREVPLLPYLREPGPMLYDIALEVGLTPEAGAETVITRTNYAQMYYSAPQDRKSTRLNSSHSSISYSPFFFNDTATTDIYTLSLHDALPILRLV